jgi:NDP-sugar pyrophosphorylase family protein
MPRIKHALIMAAGRGRRMLPLTDRIPKAMAPLNGSTLIGQGIGQMRRHIDHVHVTVGYKGAMLAEHAIGHGVSSVFNSDGHGNAWWIYNTILRHLDEPIFVLTCDNVVELDFAMLAAEYRGLGAPACMIVPVTPLAGIEGDYIFREGNVITELSRQKRSPIYCSGIQILNPHAINRLTAEGQDFHSLWRQLIAQRQLLASRVYPKRWFSVDTVEQLAEITELAPRAATSER